MGVEGTARYAEAVGLQPRLFLPFGQNKSFSLLILGHFPCSIVTSVKLRSNLFNFENNQKDLKKSKIKIQKIQKSKKIKKSKVISLCLQKYNLLNQKK